MARKKFMRHGDVVLIEVDSIPQGLKEDKEKILALGEATGHHHKFVGEGAVVMKGFDDQIYVDVQSDVAKIVHQEHGDDVGDPTYRFKDVPKGTYEVRIKREYRHGDETKVLD